MAKFLITVLAVIAATAAEPLVFANYAQPAPLAYPPYSSMYEFGLPVSQVSAALRAVPAAPVQTSVVPVPAPAFSSPLSPWSSYTQAYSYAKNFQDVAVSAPLIVEPNYQYPVLSQYAVYAPEFYKR